MEKAVETLVSNGTMAGIFLAVLLIAIVAFALWTRKLVETQLNLKDGRIEKLEASVTELQHKYNTELVNLIADNHRLMQKSNDTFNRMEKLWHEIEEKI